MASIVFFDKTFLLAHITDQRLVYGREKLLNIRDSCSSLQLSLPVDISKPVFRGHTKSLHPPLVRNSFNDNVVL